MQSSTTRSQIFPLVFPMRAWHNRAMIQLPQHQRPAKASAARQRLGLAVPWVALLVAASPVSGFTWQSGDWGVSVTDRGAPGSVSVTVTLPGAGTSSGNALEVYFRRSPTDWPQHWAFLTQGSWRQVAPGSEFLTSYHLLRYFSSADEPVDDPQATAFEVVGVTADNRLQLRLAYRGADVVSGDRFDLTADVYLDAPGTVSASMTADLTTANASGRAVVPYADNFHGRLREQWLLFAVDTMFVADNLTESFPSWWDTLDPTHAYVGVRTNTSFLDDAHSLKTPGPDVSCHDVKFITAGPSEVALDHDLPWVVLPEYDWFHHMVMMDAPAAELWARHGYDPQRNHHVEVVEASGLAPDVDDLTWRVTFARDDKNMVDGDNVRASLGLDAFLAPTGGVWPAGASQRVKLRLTAGEALGLAIMREGSGLRVVSNGGKLQSSPDLANWTDLEGARRYLPLSPVGPAGFFRQRLDVIGY